MTKIILVGCNGRMGQMINGLVAEDGDAVIVAGVDLLDNNDNGYTVYKEISECKEEADVIIDFSSAKGLEKIVDYAVEKKLPLVECSTGLSEEQTKYLLDAGKETAVLRSANMSLGVNLLLKLVKEAAKKLAFEGFDIEIGKDFGTYKTVWTDSKYDASVNGTQLLKSILPDTHFTYPKSIYNVIDCIASCVGNDKDAIVLDEPEIHLHPEWQMVYAELIVALQEKFDLNFIINTHSSHFLETLDFYAEKYGRKGICHYYLSKESEGVCSFEEVTDTPEKIYKQLVDPSLLLAKEKETQTF